MILLKYTAAKRLLCFLLGHVKRQFSFAIENITCADQSSHPCCLTSMFVFLGDKVQIFHNIEYYSS